MREWQAFIALCERKLGKATTAKWLEPLKVVDFDAANLYLEAKDSFQAAWFEEHARKEAESLLVNKSGRKIKIHLTVSGKGKADKQREVTQTSAPFRLTFDEPNADALLSEIVPFAGNELALNLFSQIASGEMELASFNPIYLSGPTGSGKSHLLMAATHALRQRGLKVTYVKGEQFTEHVVSAIRAGEMQLFRSIYRNADVLLIDDIQILGRKAATQEELHHTFNTLHVARKQLVFAANTPPQELRHIEPRLISRFEWGIVIPLTIPPAPILTKILTKKAATLGLPLAPDVLPFLVSTFQGASAIRALEALALRVHLEGHALTPHHPLSLPIAQTHLADLIDEETQTALTPERIIGAVANYYGINPQDILGKSQKKEISLPRKIAMYFCRNSLSLPFVKIGDIFSRDHSTVMTSCRLIDKEVGNSRSEIAPIVNAIAKTL